MENKVNTYLKFVHFLDTYIWDVKRFISKSIESNYDIVYLKNYISERNEKTKLSEYPEKSFGILGVNNKNGVFDAYSEIGKKINQPYKKVYNEDLIYNPYRINVGSIGRKTVDQNNNFISPAYVVFSCNKGLNSDFLYLMFKTKIFNKIINENTTGSVRQNLKFETLSNIQIPLPSIKEQENIVKAYNSKIKEAEEFETKADTLARSIEEYLFKELEIVQQKEKKGKDLFKLAKFKNIKRWDIPYLLGSVNTLQSKYSIVKFEDIITSFNDNNKSSLRINTQDYPQDKFRYLGMENIEKQTGRLLKLDDVIGIDIKSQTLKVPKNFLVYGKLRPYLNKYWINNTCFDNIICSSEFFVFDIDESINKVYFKYALSSKFIQEQISDKTSGARMPRINEEIFFNLKFPLPPLEVQEEIANKITDIKNNIKKNLIEATHLREKAIQEFEETIFA